MTSSVADLHQAFTDVHEEIRQEGSEFDFRYSLVDHLFTDALGWSRNVGEGHVNFEDEQKDLICYDDSEPPFPVIVCETKRPSHDLSLSDRDQLETYMVGVGSAAYGILTNGHSFQLYEYLNDDQTIRKVDGFDIGEIAETDVDNLSAAQEESLNQLSVLTQDRYVDLGAAEFFRQRYQEVPVEHQPGAEDEGYELFLDAVRDSLDELTEVLKTFFDDYRTRDKESYPRKFLDTTFPDWKDWRAYTGKTEDAKEAFCRETAYIILNRTLFARIAEDKEIVSHTRLSSRGMADELERDEPQPYLNALTDTYDRIDEHYPDLYELGIFDWWWVSRDKRQQFSSEETRKQNQLDEELDYNLSVILKRLNRFDFQYVNRDILGQVYEDYLPKDERKELGEYYTPLEVVQYMFDSIDYEEGEDIGQKKVIDPACGSGGFLTEATERLIQHFLEKFDKTSVHKLDAEEARIILERVEEKIYGIDINPFAVHITQINLLFRTIDLYDKVTEKDPHYTMSGFEIHVADTLSPTLLEKQSNQVDDGKEQSSLQQFSDYNGRAQSFIEDRTAVDHLKDDEEFDVVVANPPYVRIQKLDGMKDTYSSRFSSAIKNFDIYVPFIQRGLEWLSEDGQLAYICPNRLINADYAEEIRNQLVEEPITSLIDFREADVFDVPTPYPCIVTLDREETVEDRDVRCARFDEKADGALDEITYLDEWETPEDAEGYELFTYSQDALEEDNRDSALKTWKPMPQSERQVFDKIESNSELRVSSVMDEVFQGLATSADKVYIGHIIDEVEDGLVKFQPTGSDEPSLIETDVLRKVLKGNEIQRWKNDWQGLWLVFPYDVYGDDAELLSEETLKEELPHTWDFFQEYEDTLKDRESGRMRGEDDWYGYIYPKNLVKFDPKKIIVGVLRQEPSFVPDPDGEYYFVGGGTAGGYGLHVREEYVSGEDDLLYFASILNSRVLEYYHKHISFIFNSKYYSYGRNFLEPHPLTTPDSDLKEDIIAIAESIKERNDEIAELGYKTSDIQNYLPDYECDTTLLDIADSMDLDDDDYRQDPIRTNEKMNVQTTDEVYQVVMKRGHYIDFDSEEVRDFIYQLLKSQDRRLNRTEVLNMSVPSKEGILALMDEYASDKERIQELEEESDEKQAELDEMILYDVYDLSEDDKAVMEDYLEVW
ncbi:N-6 DNA methylase [Haloterrigena salifodinae]|uniref:site-specific DNA-methyltransferase (adenine-specific) n=1 Tax=Haloterrigena salifodinae TaxID=2675099 RepID=A0A8T8E339_9EURY|nr:N-6 DNA methylase [Haloterrigena salifodinae]QRV16007.1 N-6 DNA methylase [Haloterrigena salifodinae]